MSQKKPTNSSGTKNSKGAVTGKSSPESSVGSSTRNTRKGSPAYTVSSLQSGELFSRLIHKIGHDIGNPLTSIISLGTVMQRMVKDLPTHPAETQKLLHYCSLIVEESWKIALLNQRMVLTFSGHEISSSPCNLASSIERVLTRLRRRGGLKREVNVDNGIDPAKEVAFDTEQLDALFFEIMENAISAVLSFEDAGGSADLAKIYISASDSDDSVDVIVENPVRSATNSGSGDTLENLFNPFVSGDAYVSDQSLRRQGLGLAVAYAILERFGGWISIEEEFEDGVRIFRTQLSFPRVANRGETGRSNQGETSTVLGQAGIELRNTKLGESISVLLIEDESSVASAIQKILEITFGMQTSLSCSCVLGEEALKLLSSGSRYDVILCDLNLEGLSGRQVFQSISEHFPEERSKIAFLTGNRDNLDVEMFLATSGRPFLLKPFAPEELVGLVLSIIQP